MTKILSTFLIFILSILMIGGVYGTDIEKNDITNISKTLLTKQLIISKNALTKNFSTKKYVAKIDLLVEKLSDDKLKVLGDKLGNLSETSRNNIKYKDFFDYLEASIRLTLYFDEPESDIEVLLPVKVYTVKIIDDARCLDCNTDNIILSLQQVPGLSTADFNKVDFSDEGVAQYVEDNNITTLPAVIFQTNFVAPGINEYLTAINDSEFILNLGSAATFDPFAQISDRGFLMIDADVLQNIKDNSYIKGNEDAEITWIEYSDLECPYCAKLHNSTTSEDITTKYGENVNFIFNHFPLSFHQNAQTGAEVLECIAEVTSSEIFYTVLEKSYKTYDTNNFSLEGLYDIAVQEGVNKEKLLTCVESGKYTDKVVNQMNIGQLVFGVTGTPGNVLINNKTGEYEVLSGAYPTASFEDIIDRLLIK